MKDNRDNWYDKGPASYSARAVETLNGNHRPEFGDKTPMNRIEDSWLSIVRNSDDVDRADAALANLSDLIQREVDYSRSLPSTQVANLMAAGMSRAAAMQLLSGGGESAPADVAAAGNTEANAQGRVNTILNGVYGGIQTLQGLSTSIYGMYQQGLSVPAIKANAAILQNQAFLSDYQRSAYEQSAAFLQAASNYQVANPDWQMPLNVMDLLKFAQSLPEKDAFHQAAKIGLQNPYFIPFTGANLSAGASAVPAQSREDYVNSQLRMAYLDEKIKKLSLQELQTNVDWLQGKYVDYEMLRDATNRYAMDTLEQGLFELSILKEPTMREQKAKELRSNQAIATLNAALEEFITSDTFKQYKNDPNLANLISTARLLEQLGISKDGIVGNAIYGANAAPFLVETAFDRSNQSAESLIDVVSKRLGLKSDHQGEASFVGAFKTGRKFFYDLFNN